MKISLTQPQQTALKALKKGRFFKLICGGSFTDSEKVAQLTKVYTQAGVHCIDIAPDRNIIQAVEKGLSLIPSAKAPLIMVSIPLDPDPHFRKIELLEPDCVLCDACIPICPTEAIENRPEDATLSIHQDLCYGCGRCVEACPTQALTLYPTHQDPEELKAILSHPLVGAVEIHTRFADPFMLAPFLKRFEATLQHKALSLCFRPDTVKPSQWLEFLTLMERFTQEIIPNFPLILQIDGDPMSGSDKGDTSLPALQSAQAFKAQTQERFPFITISGGINAQTAHHLTQPQYQFISGVGMGTVARQAVWNELNTAIHSEAHALRIAKRLVDSFQDPQKSVIIKEKGLDNHSLSIIS